MGVVLAGTVGATARLAHGEAAKLSPLLSLTQEDWQLPKHAGASVKRQAVVAALGEINA